MFLLNGQPLSPDNAFEVNGISYPSNWLRLSTLEEKTAIGITEVAEQPRPDDRYYWVTANPDGTFTATPKDLTQLKANATAQINAAAHSLLTPSDYMAIKAAETGTALDASWKTWRAQIRTEAQTARTAIAAATDIPSLITASTVTWTLDPVAAAELAAQQASQPAK
jgi:hypothetical protein